MFPSLELDNIIQNNIEQTEQKQGISYLFDFEKGDFVIKDGKLIEIEGKEAIKVWIEKILRTDKFKFKVYEEDEGIDEYGTTIKKLIQGRKLPQFFLQSELKREIEETLQKHIEIDSIEDFRTEQEQTTLTICFTVILRNGDSFNEEVKF